MKTIDCDYVRDVYPELLHGRLASEDTDAVSAHIASCDECRAEIAVLDGLHAQLVQLPAGLPERVARAVKSPRRARFRVSDIAMAATLAAALVGGSIIVGRNSRGADAPGVAESEANTIGAVGVEDAMLSGKASLQDLSIEQLEQLLGEMES